MVKLMDSSDGESPLAKNEWVKNASQEFIRRFISLLGGPFSNLPSLLALKVIQSHSAMEEKGMIRRDRRFTGFSDGLLTLGESTPGIATEIVLDIVFSPYL